MLREASGRSPGPEESGEAGEPSSGWLNHSRALGHGTGPALGVRAHKEGWGGAQAGWFACDGVLR